MAHRLKVWPGGAATDQRHTRLPSGQMLKTGDALEDGVDVDWSPYIQRRIDCGDLVVEAPKAAPAAEPAIAATPRDGDAA